MTQADGTLNYQPIEQLAEEIQTFSQPGRRMVLVSSGAVGAGVSLLGLKSRPTDLAKLQAVAAVGQTHLIQSYDRVFAKHGRRAAQVLLTIEDVDDRIRYLNVRNTLHSLLDFRRVPIVNENDTVSVDELKTTFGDNDRLAAMVTNLLRARCWSCSPISKGSMTAIRRWPLAPRFHCREDRRARAQLCARPQNGHEQRRHGQQARSGPYGHHRRRKHDYRQRPARPTCSTRIMAGDNVGTLFLGQGKGISPFKRWLGFSAQVRGAFSSTTEHRKAILEKGRSLLAAGIVGTQGEFQKGRRRRALRRRRYRHRPRPDELLFSRRRTDQRHQVRKDRQVLGHRPYEEVIHRDNLAIVEK